VGWLRRLFGGPRRVEAHTLGMLDLSGGTAGALMAVDRAALAPLFRRVSESADAPPEHAAARVLLDRLRRGHPQLATEPAGDHPGLGRAGGDRGHAQPGPEGYTAAANRRKPLARANLVMTLDRRGDAFAHFFQHLITDMKQGTSMPRAWVKLAPQAQRAPHVDCPDTIFACELAPLAFS